MKVDKAPPEEIGSEKENLTIEAHPTMCKYPIILEKKLTIEAHDTNRHPTLPIKG